VIVAAAGGDQAEVAGQGEQAGPLRLGLVGVENLHAGQARGGQHGDLVVGHVKVPARAGVGQDGDTTGRADQPDGQDRIQGVPVDVGAAALADPVAAEGLAGLGDGSAVHHGPGQVRTADYGRPGDGGHLVPGDIDAQIGQRGHHGAGPEHAVVADALGLFGQLRLAWVEQVGQQVQAVLSTGAVQPGGQLHAGDQGEGVWESPAGLRMPGHRVVVGQGHRIQAGRRGAAHHLGRGVGPVRGVAVHMQVGPHYDGRRGEGAPKGRSRSWPGSRRSRSPIGSISSAPAVSGQSTTHTQCALISPANTARSGEATCQSGKSCLPNDAVAIGGAEANPDPGSTLSRPATAAPRPTPGSSARTSISAGPPSGFGPDSATAQARVPVRSSPAPAKPVTSQPDGSGQGSHTGTPDVRSSPSRPSRDGLKAGSRGSTSPCQSQRQALDHAVGSWTWWPQRGQDA